MVKSLKTFLILNSIYIILIMAAVLRLWNLGGNPPHLTPDEASLGYNTYSILKTGRDEYGEILPFVFKSFGDYKPGLYVYTALPSIFVFGITEFATRFPSALAGIIAIWLLYQIVKLLFPDKKYLAEFSSLLLAISPWHIQFSRGAWEVNLALTLTLAGIYFFLKSLQNSKFLIHGSVFFALTLLAYQGAKLSTGIAVAVLLLLYIKKVLKFPRKVILKSLIIGLVIAIPIVVSLFQGKGGRLTVFSVFSYPRPREYTQAFLDEANVKFGSLKYYLFYSETLNFKRGVLGRWFNHFSGRFLFFEGDWPNPRHSAPYHGMLLLGDLVLLLVGLYALVRRKASKEAYFIWLWLALAPFPAALSRDQVHAVRSLNMIIPLTIILAFGLSEIAEWINRAKVSVITRKGLAIFLILVYLATLTRFLDLYFLHQPIHNSKYWEYGYKQIVETVTPIQGNYERIKVQQSFAQPYIYFLFYGGDGYSQGYDPSRYQEQAKLVSSEYKGDVGYVERLDNIEFVPIDWSVNRGESGTLFVADPIRIPPQDSSDENLFNLIKEIKYLDNREVAFRIIEVK